ncbi:BolA/IbaG family iron-sulfur metabolism protein [Marinobacteraceae bacterium S3BR75-40.1]
MSIQTQLEQKLSSHFQPQHLEVENESHQHAVPPNSETHFKVTLVSDAFEGKRKVARHQAVYQIVNDELQQGLHALALHIYTPEEWQARQQQSPDSPECMGGSKRDSASGVGQ